MSSSDSRLHALEGRVTHLEQSHADLQMQWCKQFVYFEGPHFCRQGYEAPIDTLKRGVWQGWQIRLHAGVDVVACHPVGPQGRLIARFGDRNIGSPFDRLSRARDGWGGNWCHLRLGDLQQALRLAAIRLVDEGRASSWWVDWQSGKMVVDLKTRTRRFNNMGQMYPLLSARGKIEVRRQVRRARLVVQ